MTISDEPARAKNIRIEQVPLLRRNRGATNETLHGLPDAAIRRALRRLNHPDLPNARRLFRLEQERGDDGTVPAHAQGTALDRMRAPAEQRTPFRADRGRPHRAIVALALCATLTFSLLARGEYRRARTLSTE
ncbi:hypothetical protein [Streptomyces canus]|uniref:hypothetical protein n=1 Tax=Streptomyces canus TaxID=58343 RepID=UPI0030E386CB